MILQPVAKSSPSLRQWRWGLTRWYNGFSPQERIRGWQVSHWLQAIDYLPRPKQCEVCGGQSGVSYHNENYYTPWLPYSLCKSCHYVIHNRHRLPEKLPALLRQHGAGRGGWLRHVLAGDFENLAAEVRAREGTQRAYIENHLPDNLNTVFPKHQLYPLATDHFTAGEPHSDR